eukprot:m.166986 g.166986  ORF g.166986 m.166986 type:complete len:962 (+) comp15299_c0_seq4:100-2985(+)
MDSHDGRGGGRKPRGGGGGRRRRGGGGFGNRGRGGRQHHDRQHSVQNDNGGFVKRSNRGGRGRDISTHPHAPDPVIESSVNIQDTALSALISPTTLPSQGNTSQDDIPEAPEEEKSRLAKLLSGLSVTSPGASTQAPEPQRFKPQSRPSETSQVPKEVVESQLLQLLKIQKPAQGKEKSLETSTSLTNIGQQEFKAPSPQAPPQPEQIPRQEEQVNPSFSLWGNSLGSPLRTDRPPGIFGEGGSGLDSDGDQHSLTALKSLWAIDTFPNGSMFSMGPIGSLADSSESTWTAGPSLLSELQSPTHSGTQPHQEQKQPSVSDSWDSRLPFGASILPPGDVLSQRRPIGVAPVSAPRPSEEKIGYSLNAHQHNPPQNLLTQHQPSVSYSDNRLDPMTRLHHSDRRNNPQDFTNDSNGHVNSMPDPRMHPPLLGENPSFSRNNQGNSPLVERRRMENNSGHHQGRYNQQQGNHRGSAKNSMQGASPMQQRRSHRHNGLPGGMSPNTTSILSANVEKLLKNILPLESESKKHAEMLNRLRAIVQNRWPNAVVETYGSTASNLGLRGADVDATMMYHDLDAWTQLVQDAEEMEFSDEDYGFQYSRSTRTRPTEGRNASDKWQKKQAERKKKAEERKKEQEAKEAQEDDGDTEVEENDKDKSVSRKTELKNNQEDSEADQKNENDADKQKNPLGDWGGPGNLIVRLGRDLARAGMEQVMPLPKARVPVVKFLDTVTKVSCDVCLDNRLACENTRLLRTYTEIDGRVRRMVVFVKYWAKQRGVNSPYKGTLSSYAYVLLVIFFLQNRPEPIVPVLQQMRVPGNEGPHLINGHNCYFCDDLAYIQSRGFGVNSRNTETIGELLIGFYSWLANGFNYKENIVSIRTGQALLKTDKEWTIKNNTRNDRYWWCIEDPFELSHNLGRVADQGSLFTMRGEFMRAVNLLKRAKIHELYEPFEEGDTRETGRGGRN